ncbi:MAG: response regulator, partial [Candidatus Saccharibacteria bacterium]|nr:response regulator [Candidatus Saccharibacteria bacterium]
ISIIEDDQLIAQMYRMKLELEGYEVDVAENGMNGIAMVAQRSPDLILLDYTLPDINGDAVLKEIRRNGTAENVPVIVLTNMEDQSISDELAKLDITDYIVKVNLTPREVVAKINQTLGRSADAAN